MSAPIDMAMPDVLGFLERWFSQCPKGQLLELRPLQKRTGRPCPQAWFDTAEGALGYAGESVLHGDDVYLGALPRLRRSGRAEAVGAHVWLWADLDYGSLGHARESGYATREAALQALHAFSLPPSMLVETGGGFHAWWALRGTPAPHVWKAAMARVAHALNADLNAADPPRILRVPGTFNHKAEPPRPVKLVEARSGAFSVQDFLALAAPPPREEGRPRRADAAPREERAGDTPAPVAREKRSARSSARPRGDQPFDRANNVPVGDVLAWLGTELCTQGARVYCACPVHGGSNKTQMVVGGTANVAHCFGDCGRGFTCVDLVAAVRHVPPREAVNVMAERFGFAGFTQPPPPAQDEHAVEVAAPRLLLAPTREGASASGAVEAREAPPPEKPPSTPDDDGPPPESPDGSWYFARGDQLELAHATLERLETGPLTYDEGEFWRYAPALGIWERLGLEHVTFAASAFAGCPVFLDGRKKPKPLCLGDAALRGAVNLARVVLVNREARPTFATKRMGVAFRNGFAVIEDGTVRLLPHAPEHMCRYAFPFDYNPKFRTPLLVEFFSELFGDVTEEEGADRERVLQEFVGACLTGAATRYQRLLLITGGGGNGKSEFFQLVRALFPPGGVAAVPPQEWGERFKVARLVGVLANFVDEIPEREITTGEVFKSVITGDPVSTERKNRDPFEFRPIAGHIFSANTLPGTVDQSDGFWRRLTVCPFTRDFQKADTRKPNAAAEVVARELPGLAVWALHGAARLQEAGDYSVTDGARVLLREWRDEADPVRRFVSEAPWAGPPKEPVAAATLYLRWRNWAKDNGFADMSSTKFGRRIISTGAVTRIARKEGRFYQRV